MEAILTIADSQNKEEESLNYVEPLLNELTKEIDKLELNLFLSGEYDKRNATLTIYAGAGGEDAQDWARMLLEMYRKYCERNGYKFEILDENKNEMNGIKSAVIKITGEYAYGYLKGENGVHRLVRISPFDASNQRHTSFASVEVLPEIEKEEIDLKKEDLEVEFLRSSGPGGQNVNKVETAVRIKHLPTNIVVTCQIERSQNKNYERALEILRSKLYLLEKEKISKEKQQLKGTKKEITFSSQIRSYILHPYKLVKDYRTGIETTDVEGVLRGGNLDIFIENELKMSYTKK